MNTTRLAFASVCGLLLSAAPHVMADPKEYPMTGPIISLTDTTMIVQQTKTRETWEFARTAETKTAPDLKVGDVVTVRYTMQAVSVQPKAEKAAKAVTAAAAAGSSSAAKPAAAAAAKP